MGRFQTARGTGRAGTGADAKLVKPQQNGFAFHVFKGNIGRIGQAVFGITIDPTLWNTGQ